MWAWEWKVRTRKEARLRPVMTMRTSMTPSRAFRLASSHSHPYRTSPVVECLIPPLPPPLPSPPSPPLPSPSPPLPLPSPSPPTLVKAPEDSAVVAMDATDKLVAYLSCGVSGVTVKVYSGSLTAPAKQSPGEGGAEGVWCGRGRWNECLIQATCCASMIMRGVECVSAVEPQKQLSLCSVMLPLGGWWVVQ